MLVGKDHVGGEGSCWWGRIMPCLQNDEECKNIIFALEKSTFSYKDAPCVRSQHELQQTICQLAPDLLTTVPRSKKQVDVEIIGKIIHFCVV